jgi:alpha,alpha-trehalose-phosphate synthase [UDP-forming]/trehalose-phosphatase
MTPSSVDHWEILARHSPLGVLLDLDGTLIHFADRPEDARPTPEQIALLDALAERPGVALAVVSGRPRESMDQMFSSAPRVWLVAEHGGWLRGDGAWQATTGASPGALDALARAFDAVAGAHPRAWVERKTWSVCLHYRGVPARERIAVIVEANAAYDEAIGDRAGFERLEGASNLEVRPASIRKSAAIPWMRQRVGLGARLIALGDDLTDEDMFRALGAGDEAIQVGSDVARATAASWRLDGPEATGAFLRWILAARAESKTPPPEVLPVPVVRRPRVAAAPSPHRLLAISNRLPDLRVFEDPTDRRKQGVGGLVSALEPVLGARGGLWLGWSGRTALGDEPGPPQIVEGTSPPLAWMDFPQGWAERYYNGFCNRSLWPLFHSFPSRVRFVDAEWEAYEAVNEAFADAAVGLVDADATIWVHDFHMLLLAGALRRRGHRGPIGLFLHVPFPGPDMFSMIPWADRLLDELLQFDLIGLHTRWHVENLRHCVGALTPARLGDDVIEHRGRRIRVDAFPIGIMPEGFQEPPEPAMAEEIGALIQATSPGRLVLGVDRLDYTKGILERLRAFARLCVMFPEWRGKASCVQISVPSRADVPDYAEQRAQIENAVGRINGELGEASWVPVRYLYRSYPRNELSQLYRAADVGYVTPLRDGMNLVAKEYVAAQDPQNPGVLLLSRFAGAAFELSDAVLTNPWHADGMARDLDRALRMPLEERRERHAKLLAAVMRTTAVTWAEDFLRALEACRRA